MLKNRQYKKMYEEQLLVNLELMRKLTEATELVKLFSSQNVLLIRELKDRYEGKSMLEAETLFLLYPTFKNKRFQDSKRYKEARKNIGPLAC